MTASVKLQDVTKLYRQGTVEVRALGGINLEFVGGDFQAIMGPSGSGKSTLLHILGCLDQPSQGIVEIDGTQVQNLAPANLWSVRNSKIGFVFQNHFLIEALTAVENVMLPLKYARENKAESYSRASDLLGKMGLSDRINHRPSQLSGGEKARVAIARALINEPTLILADEPTGELDSTTGMNIMEILHNLRSPERICVIVTHDQAVADQCDKVIQMRDGMVTT